MQDLKSCSLCLRARKNLFIDKYQEHFLSELNGLSHGTEIALHHEFNNNNE
jgi:hypothetical protein